jgi:mannose-1-phosphate guanylyltransferase
VFYDREFLNSQARDSGAEATLAVARGFEVPIGLANVEGRTVKGWVEKPRIDLYAGISIVVLDRDAVEPLRVLSANRGNIDIMGELIPYLIGKGRRVEVYVTDRFWYDVGSTEKYEKLDNDLIDRIFKV